MGLCSSRALKPDIRAEKQTIGWCRFACLQRVSESGEFTEGGSCDEP